MAESSSAPQWKYDVFLSFRGEDTREGFLSHLYHELQNTRGINTFKDDKELEVGAPISPSLLNAIEESRFAIVVLSQNYAASPWCLEELTKICHCMQEDNRILPIFYRVDPSDVRYQKNSFREAFTKHENSRRHSSEKLQQWRHALKKVGDYSGLHTQNYKSESELIGVIAKLVWDKIDQVRMEIESTMSNTYFEAYQVTQRTMDQLMLVLKDDQITLIGVYGMGGVGKTAMVKFVGEQARRNSLFDHVIMAVITQNPDVRKIQRTLADLLGLKLERKSEIGRASQLKEKIMRGTRILIILDDIWNNIDFSRIGIPSHKELQRCKSKVLLTTRRLSVCHSVESHANIPLNILSEPDSWSLFEKESRKVFDKSTDLYDIARKVARECAGLPVALIAVARALRDMGLDKWDEAARRLQLSQSADPEDEGNVFNSIKLSYDYLKSDVAKSCFLLCCLFPEDYEINIDDELLKYGFGSGLFEGSNTIQEARAIAYSEVKYLKASSLLLDGQNDEYVRMHDVVRDVAVSISSSEDGQRFFVKAGRELKNWPKMNAHKDYSAVSVMVNEIHKLPEALVCPKLQILLLKQNNNLNEIPESFLQNLNALTVLDISRTGVCLLPLSFCLLTNLRTLILDNCKFIVDFSFLGKLKNLEILCMVACCPKDREFPKEIGNLFNLRILDINSMEVKKIPSRVISKLLRLEELYMRCGFGDWGCKVERGEEANARFHELIGLSDLNTLEAVINDAESLPKNVRSNPRWSKFKIYIWGGQRCDWVKYDDNFTNVSRVLTLGRVIYTLPDWFINVMASKTETLQYVECDELTNIVEECDYGKLHDVKHLNIYGPHENLEALMNTTARVSTKPVLEKLESLLLYCVDGLEQLCVGELPPRSLCNLKQLTMKDCNDLRNACLPSNLLKRLESLETLDILDANRSKYVFGSASSSSSSSSSSDCLEPEHMTKLSIFKLRDSKNLIKIWSGPSTHAVFHNLKIFAVMECRKLKSLFPFSVAQGLLQLEDLWVDKCGSLKWLIEPCEETVKNKRNMIIVFPKLKNIVLNELPQVMPLDTDAIEYPSLECMLVNDCPKFKPPSSFFCKSQVQDPDQFEQFLYSRVWEVPLDVVTKGWGTDQF